MANTQFLAFSIPDRSKWLGVLALSLALAACGGGGGKKGGNRAVVGDPPEETEQPGKGGDAGDISGRWKVTSTMGPNSCELSEETETEEWDATQSGNKVTFKNSEGDVVEEGTLNGNTLTAPEKASNDDYNFTGTTTYVFDGATFTAEETFTCQPIAGGQAGSGKVQYSGAKTSGPAPTKPGTPTTPDTPSKPGTPTTPEPPGTSPGGSATDKEPNNTVDDAPPIKAGDVVQGTVNSQTDELDLYGLTTSATIKYSVSLKGFEGNDLDLCVVHVVDDKAECLVASESGPGIDETVSFAGADAAQSTVYILVFASDTAATTSEYTLKVTRQ